jgi:very-long-chain enoyl-CoA reductase
MPIMNIFKNSGYYWGFGALCGYFVNHPYFTNPEPTQVYVALGFFVVRSFLPRPAHSFSCATNTGFLVAEHTCTRVPLLTCFSLQLCEIGNLISHIQLRNLRPPGTTVRRIPRGFLFELVSCPNYTCEILAWVCFSFMTQSVAGMCSPSLLLSVHEHTALMDLVRGLTSCLCV